MSGPGTTVPSYKDDLYHAKLSCDKSRSKQARPEAILEFLALELLPDEDQLVDALLAVLPLPPSQLGAAKELAHHVHALEDVPAENTPCHDLVTRTRWKGTFLERAFFLSFLQVAQDTRQETEQRLMRW